jgi:hypothetical protein
MTNLQVYTGGHSSGRPSRRERDFILLNIFVLAQQGYIDRAGVLAEALYLMEDRSADVLFARAIVRFFSGEWRETLSCLEELDREHPIERFGTYKLTERERMRRYLKARCLYELKERAGARDAVESYLRHGVEVGEEAE